MSKLKSFIKTAVLGGLVVVLPVAILVAVFLWLFGFITGIIRPLTLPIAARIAEGRETLITQLIALAIILLGCFLLGLLVRTRVGRFIHVTLEGSILLKIPGYSLVKETVLQFLGNKRSPFSAVALANIFGNETLVTSFVTDEHEDGSFTVFVPTGPNPTSGSIYHLDARFVHPVEISVEDAMRSIISCGAGSSTLLDAHHGRTGSS